MAPAIFYRLVARFGNPEAVWKAPESDLAETLSTTQWIYDHLIELRKREDGSEEIARCCKEGCMVSLLYEPDYPKPLRGIPVPPPVLYIKGEWKPEDERAVAMVGTRECNGYGRRVAEDFSADLAKRGFTVVSGLAHGIDAMSHRGALSAGGRTIAVKAVGIDVNYPSAHKKLAEDIAGQGALMSEFPLGMVADDLWRFHRRNRIISGLALGTVVIQAREKSGSMITANHAFEQNRQVFAVPGDIFSPLAEGCHWLIRHGAYLAQSADDIIEIIGGPTVQTEIDFNKAPLEGNQAAVMGSLKNGPCHFDEICETTGLKAQEVATALLMLEMKGYARQLPGKLYEAHR